MLGGDGGDPLVIGGDLIAQATELWQTGRRLAAACLQDDLVVGGRDGGMDLANQLRDAIVVPRSMLGQKAFQSAGMGALQLLQGGPALQQGLNPWGVQGSEPSAQLGKILGSAIGDLLQGADLLLDQATPVLGEEAEEACGGGVRPQWGEAVAVMAEQIQQQECVTVVVLGAGGEEGAPEGGRHGGRHRVQD